MPARPFPFQLGIGTDVCHVPRIRKLLTKESTNGSNPVLAFTRQFLTYREQKDFWRIFQHTRNVLGPRLDHAAMYLAGRWAAKEATIKAVRYRRLRAMEVEILRYPSVQGRGGIYALILDNAAPSKPFKSPLDPHREPVRSVRNEESMVSYIRTEKSQIFFGAAEQTSDGSEHDSTPDPQYGDLQGQIAKVSISHDGEYATAVCIAAEEAMPGDVGGEAAARMP